jgi:hypothetical protein
MISVACNSRIPQAILQPGLLFKQVTIFQFMKHNSLADFTDKVISKELLNITKKSHCIPFCLCSNGRMPPFRKKPKVRWLDAACEIENIREN